MNTKSCPDCEGFGYTENIDISSGEIEEFECKKCNGSGVIEEEDDDSQD